MVNVLATAQTLTNDYTALARYIGACSGAPGSGAAPLNEATGGSPAYARAATTWTAGSNGSASGSAITLNLPPGNYPYIILCSAATGATMTDWCILQTAIQLSVQTAVTVTPSVSTA